MLNTKIPCDCHYVGDTIVPVPSYIFPQNSGPSLGLAMEDQLHDGILCMHVGIVCSMNAIDMLEILCMLNLTQITPHKI